MENEKYFSINYSKEVKDFIKNRQNVLDQLNEFQGFMPTNMVRVYSKLDDFIFDKMSTSIKMSADVFVDDKKLEKWAKMCMALENMTKEEIEDIAVRHYVEKLENKMNNKLAKYEKAFEIFKGREVQIYPKFDGNTQYVITLNKEQYELLEEVIKDEK